MRYSAAHFIRKFESIPTDQFLSEPLDFAPDGPMGVLQHCGGDHLGSEEADALMELLKGWDLRAICDGRDPRAPGKTVKERILAALRGI